MKTDLVLCIQKACRTFDDGFSESHFYSAEVYTLWEVLNTLRIAQLNIENRNQVRCQVWVSYLRIEIFMKFESIEAEHMQP